MRDEQRHVVGSQVCFLQHLNGNLRHRTHGNLEKLIPFHFEEVIACSQCFGCRSLTRATAGRIKLFQISAIGLNSSSKNSLASLRINRTKDGGARAIAEQYACATVRVVDVLRQNFRTNHENVPGLLRPDHRLSQR